MNSTFKLVLICLLVVVATVGVVGAAVYLSSPEHVTGTPTASPSPTPTATPTPTPTPSSILVPTVVHLYSNNTTPFYIGDTLHLTAQLDLPIAGVVITLYNNGEAKIANSTDATGTATFDRAPTVKYDYHVVAALP